MEEIIKRGVSHSTTPASSARDVPERRVDKYIVEVIGKMKPMQTGLEPRLRQLYREALAGLSSYKPSKFAMIAVGRLPARRIE